MNVSTARRIDIVAGTLISLALRAVRFLRPERGVPETSPLRSALVVKCFGFGSILEMAPMLAALREARPEVRVTLLTFAQNGAIAGLMPAIDELVTVEFRRGLFRFAWDSLRAVAVLRRRKFDAILDCEFFSYYVALLAYCIRRPETVTVGFFNNRRLRDWMFTRLIAIETSRHISRIFCKMLLPFGIAPRWRPLLECPLRVGEAARSRVETVLAALAVPAGVKRVVVNVNASDLCPNRRWPRDSFEALLRRMIAPVEGKPAVAAFLIGGNEDAGYVSALAARFPGEAVYNLAGKIGIEELAALMQCCDLYAGNDSGPLHLAVAAGLPTVSIFGPETPGLYGPLGEGHRVFFAERYCSPCLNLFYSKDTACRDNRCLQEISPEAVYEAVRDALEKGREPS